LRGVALHCRRMPVVLLNSRIVGDPEVGQKRALGPREKLWFDSCNDKPKSRKKT